MRDKPSSPGDRDGLRHQAEERLLAQQKAAGTGDRPKEEDAQRQLHELQVHQIELEMQNTELHETKNRLELLLDKFTDLYDFAPIGYFTVDDSGRIQEANLTGSVLLGLERSLVVGRMLSDFVVPAMKKVFRDFLRSVFGKADRQTCEVALKKTDGATIWVDLQGNEAADTSGSGRICRLAASDITPLKRAEEAQAHMEALLLANQKLQQEIEHRKEVEKNLRDSQKQQNELLKQAELMQTQLRELSHMILHSQEEERRRISLELHDEIAQTLVGVNVHLMSLVKDPSFLGSEGLQKIVSVCQLVENSVSQVHRFAMELRPPILDDLGLIPALNSFLKEYTRQTKIPVQCKSNSGLEKLDKDHCTVLYRVIQEALTNAARHAQASEIEIRIHKAKNTLKMEIHDNGKSFDVERDLDFGKRRRLGLIGMRERMEMMGGSFQIFSSPGKGTTVSVSIPFRRYSGKALKHHPGPL